MNQKQRDYALTRVNETERDLIKAITEKYTKQAVSLTPHQRFVALKKGEFVVRKDTSGRICNYTDLMDIIEFKDEKSKAIDKKAIERESIKITEKLTVIRDEIMLGDAGLALKSLKALKK